LAQFLQEDDTAKSRIDMPDVFFSALEQNKKLKSRWETTNLFLKANFGMMDGQRQYRMLHATAAISCHPTLFRLASSLYPQQAAELDKLRFVELETDSAALGRCVLRIWRTR
jgi:hypothetical protein